MKNHKKCFSKMMSLIRILMGWIFLWAFFDKLFGLGFSTCRMESGTVSPFCSAAWLKGGSPTTGFLRFASKGPFAEIYQSMAGSALVDWLFMLGLLFVGVALIFGIVIKLGAYVGALMFVLMYTAGFIWPEHNPFVDEHIIYALLLLVLAMGHGNEYWSLDARWSKLGIVKRFPILR